MQIADAAATTTAVTSSPNPSVFGQSVLLEATVTPVPPATGSPTGTVIFRSDGTQIATGTLIGAGFTVATTSTLAPGNHTITASYTGNSTFAPSTSSPRSQVVNRATTTTSMYSLPNPSLVGQPVTFNVLVSGAAEGPTRPSGTVIFRDGATHIGTVALNGSGLVAFTTPTLTAGNHTITASYDGDANFTGSAALPVSQVVNRATTTTAVTSSANPSTSGQAVTFTATVRPVAPGAGTPTGAVRFLANGTQVGTGTLNANAVTTFTTSALAAGSHTITASYDGSASFNASVGSLPGGQVVSTPPSICADPAGAFNQGFNAGFNPGFNAGFNPGYRAGFNRGYNVGFGRGRSADVPVAGAQPAPRQALPPACNQAFNQGFNTGFNPGFDSGFNRGFQVGFNPGFNAGFRARHRA